MYNRSLILISILLISVLSKVFYLCILITWLQLESMFDNYIVLYSYRENADERLL